MSSAICMNCRKGVLKIHMTMWIMDLFSVSVSDRKTPAAGSDEFTSERLGLSLVLAEGRNRFKKYKLIIVNELNQDPLPFIRYIRQQNPDCHIVYQYWNSLFYMENPGKTSSVFWAICEWSGTISVLYYLLRYAGLSKIWFYI